MMFRKEVTGLIQDVEESRVKPRQLIVHYTSDEFGKSLSIGDIKTNLQFQIPFDELYKIITGGEE